MSCTGHMAWLGKDRLPSKDPPHSSAEHPCAVSNMGNLPWWACCHLKQDILAYWLSLVARRFPLSQKEIITSPVTITLFGHLDKNLYVFSGGLGDFLI